MAHEEPENLQEIFDFGSLFHALILEPHIADMAYKDIQLALEMRDTYWKDPVCRQFSMASDFSREKAFYEERQVGPYKVKLRCKADGARERVKFLLELKGLKSKSEKEFRSALTRMNYDQAVAHYLITTGYETELIAGISKSDPRKMFKWICYRHDEFYMAGEQKLIDDLTLLRQYSPDDVVLV